MSLYGSGKVGTMENNRYIKSRLEELHQNPLADYSTLQLQEELARRRRSHVMLRIRVKLQLHRRYKKMLCQS